MADSCMEIVEQLAIRSMCIQCTKRDPALCQLYMPEVFCMPDLSIKQMSTLYDLQIGSALAQIDAPN